MIPPYEDPAMPYSPVIRYFSEIIGFNSFLFPILICDSNPYSHPTLLYQTHSYPIKFKYSSAPPPSALPSGVGGRYSYSRFTGVRATMIVSALNTYEYVASFHIKSTSTDIIHHTLSRHNIHTIHTIHNSSIPAMAPEAHSSSIVNAIFQTRPANDRCS